MEIQLSKLQNNIITIISTRNYLYEKLYKSILYINYIYISILTQKCNKFDKCI